MRFVPRRLAAMFAAFVMLGLPEGVLGTAWPTMRSSLDQPESALARLIIAYTVGYLLATALLGRIVERLGNDMTIRAGMSLTVAGLGGYAIAQTLGVAIGAALALGVGGGIVDATINADVARHHGPRTMNLLHASFGIGATLGPLLMVTILETDRSWRIAYVVLFVLEIAILSGFASNATRRSPGVDGDSSSTAAPVQRPRLVLGATLVYFAVYVGAEVSVGHWSYSILVEERGIGTTTAGLAVASYWGGLTAGRLVLGVLADRIDSMVLLRVSGSVAMVAIVWFLLDVPGSPLALSILGLTFAGIFPALVLMTSRWLPDDELTRAVGWQLAAASAGAIVASAALGALADRSGLDATIIGMTVLVAGLLVSQLVVESAVRA